jgi:hypothetical protein
MSRAGFLKFPVTPGRRRLRTVWLGLAASAAVALAPARRLGAQQTSLTVPTTGADVFQRMHDAYRGAWYRTLRFVQKTTQYRPDGAKVIGTWYESLRQTDTDTELRIDFGDPRSGNGVKYTADSTWRVQGGKVTRVVGSGNEFLPLIQGVYLQPVTRTIEQLAGTGVAMDRVTAGTWEDQPVWIIGVRSPADSTAPQIWISKDRNVLVRMILAPAPGAQPLDIRLDDYVPVGHGWLATRVTMLAGGRPAQVEEYADWKADVPLSGALFDLTSWMTAPHWGAR